MSSIKDRNRKDLTEAEKINKRWQEYREQYKKGFDDPDNYGGTVTHLEPDILVCEVKWALGNITMNKASGGDRILDELFKIPKDDAVKVRTEYGSKFGKPSSDHGTGKCPLSFQRRARPKKVHTTIQLCSFHMLAR